MIQYDVIWCYMMLYDVIWCFMTMLKILGDCSIMIDTLVGGWDTRTANFVTLLDRGSSPNWQSKQIWNEPTCSSLGKPGVTGSESRYLVFESPTSLGSTGKISPAKTSDETVSTSTSSSNFNVSSRKAEPCPIHAYRDLDVNSISSMWPLNMSRNQNTN
jgi:hypothetical protein